MKFMNNRTIKMNRYISPVFGYLAGIIVMVTVALGLRLWGIGHGLPQRFQDENNYVVSALKIAGGDVKIGFPANSPNLHQGLLILGYGGLFIAGTATGAYESLQEFADSYQIDPSPFYLIGRLESVLFSVLSVIVLWFVARRLYGLPGAWVAAFILAITYNDVRHAHLVEPYTLISFVVILSVCASLLFIDTHKVRYLALTAWLAGIAVSQRLSFAPLLFVPFIAYLIYLRSGHPRQIIMVSLLTSVATVLGIVTGYPGLLINFDQFIFVMREIGGYAMRGGLDGAELTAGWQYYPSLLVQTLGWLYLATVAGGLIIAVKERRQEWLPVLAFPVLYSVALIFSQMSFLRYTVPLAPFAALLVGLTISRFSQAIAVRVRTPHGWVAVALCVMVGYSSFVNVIGLNSVWSRESTRIVAKRWIEDNIPAGAKIAYQWGAPALATASDPEPFSKRVYQTTLISQTNPDEYSSVERYQTAGYSYIILSSYIYDWPRVDPNENQIRERFYKSLADSGRLVAEFGAYDSGSGLQEFLVDDFYGPTVDFEHWIRPGPQLSVYAIEPLQAK